MKFKYVCTCNKCSEEGKVVIVSKCPCHAFTKEYCKECNARLEKYKSSRDYKREAILKAQRENR